VIETAPVRHFRTIDSTNLEARRLFDHGERGPLWLIADEQTAGRGRLDRVWTSERGNLFSTLLLSVSAPQSAIPQIGFVVAIAVQKALSNLAQNISFTLKWPNDCLANGAKISGILCETLSPNLVAIGCGINVEHAPQGLPYPASSLRQLGRPVFVNKVFAAYREELSAALALWNNGKGFEAIRKEWQAHAIGIGERVAMSTGEVMVEGTYEGIAEDGALILIKSDGKRHLFHSGDLSTPSLQAMRKVSA
jgi:BirA family transcriptional regulator, biotin operon repressor / biotin---[acetyl-CoA-carboxylase] ligase